MSYQSQLELTKFIADREIAVKDAHKCHQCLFVMSLVFKDKCH